MYDAAKKKILLLVEGEKRDVAVMESLFKWYPELSDRYQIVPYRANIYKLYHALSMDDDSQEEYDLLQTLKANEPNPEKKKIFDEKYTDILLVFDLDPQDTKFSEDKIRKMQTYFRESTDMGKLYLNYPMIEAFYHMRTIPDPDFSDRKVCIQE